MHLVFCRCQILQYSAGKISQAAQGLRSPQTHPKRRPAAYRHQAAERETNPIAPAVLGGNCELEKDPPCMVSTLIIILIMVSANISVFRKKYIDLVYYKC